MDKHRAIRILLGALKGSQRERLKAELVMKSPLELTRLLGNRMRKVVVPAQGRWRAAPYKRPRAVPLSLSPYERPR